MRLIMAWLLSKTFQVRLMLMEDAKPPLTYFFA